MKTEKSKYQTCPWLVATINCCFEVSEKTSIFLIFYGISLTAFLVCDDNDIVRCFMALRSFCHCELKRIIQNLTRDDTTIQQLLF